MHGPNVGEFCWNELVTPNAQAAKEFYGKVFGWEFIDHDMGEMTYTMIKSGENELGGIWEIPTQQKDEIPPHWMGYILVESVEATLEHAQQQGATVKVPVTNVSDFGRFAMFIDPTGAHIAIWESLTSCC